MTVGLLAFILGSAAFIGWAIPHMYYPALLGSYALRGLGYPLFAYSFLVWVSYSTSQNILGKAVGWFWFMFTCGLNVLGPFYSSYAVPAFGEINTLWSALLFVAAGGILALFLTKINLLRYKNKISRNGKNCRRHLRLCLKTLR